MADSACAATTRSLETRAMVDTACAAKTRSRETQATAGQWLVSTLSLETQVCENFGFARCRRWAPLLL